MTTIASPSAHAVAIEGTFDDCQDLVKAMFADRAFRAELALSAVNSINLARSHRNRRPSSHESCTRMPI